MVEAIFRSLDTTKQCDEILERIRNDSTDEEFMRFYKIWDNNARLPEASEVIYDNPAEKRLTGTN